MGTSNSYGGQSGGTPLVPTWLDGEDDNQSVPDDGNDNSSDIPTPPPDRQPPTPGEPIRFRNPRTNFTRFAKSGGNDKASFARAISGYVSKSSGGSRQATKRMGSSKTAITRLGTFLSNVTSGGVNQALRTFNLENLAGRPIEEVFLALADYICPEGGTIDEGIARSAFIETIAELAESGVTDLDSLTVDQTKIVLELYITHTIEIRLCNDIGTKINIAPMDLQAFERTQNLLHDFILRGVSDAIANEAGELEALSLDFSLSSVEQIYKQTFDILEIMANQELVAA